MLKLVNVCKKYRSHQVLNRVTFTVDRSTIVGLAGPSGCGKSTLLRCIQQLETIDEGEVECWGKRGFMFQDFQLFPHMTVLKNLTYATRFNKGEGDERCAKQLLEDLGIPSKIDLYPHQLSGGEKQRVALARSLMMHPDLLLCDEPTSGLDVTTILDVVSLLQSVRDRKITMILASHDLDFLTHISDRILLLKEGEIILDFIPQGVEDPVGCLKKYY